MFLKLYRFYTGEGQSTVMQDLYPKVLNYKKQSVTEKTLKEFAHLWTKTAAYRKCHDIKTVQALLGHTTAQM